MRIALNVVQKVFAAAALAAIVLARSGVAAPPERVYIACDDHTD